ncbi:hypothetical protein A2331_02390 [Candidatus Falkowbacteria bacterium RIFOXYB2_FULL_34_18]|uniref:Thymidylate kinase n=1 Tax=Candidatus Falkowbacteria bacterium RIFOXYD2_FULL_34_120 TaxID=1798007 RepID=A0A1F5TSA7_9BACT|nr:MAG: hypothetical protein A2331_02390 [Candidatus Falkowbacteria bacterium RIFOXYB2_FULL_34_18]OGF29690.1 MAG: hypothetical protein A2500_00235 [Candidatus Falkowbacteria bacterium RIFOXYC12_FULL_34_55]OGF37445.1 MAG: hypothetical protein A2466_00485 [Candidatus Falkowbacteria bacterium RIFOXYC2_FULL_34_220]OGF39170.1 MAG: hypothetical protein A2515_00440 [Candidatus Falkowbacteria bacterium RIFOXYD12_FULL_34_57]OGF41719.1 MAG: hypothetical protein A2531_06160 [Candidatus Falkowbacteria bact
MFFKYKPQNYPGYLVVIDGTDGSGKETQTKLLAERLEKEGLKAKIVDFPQYGKKSAGSVEEYLNGKYGDADTVGPWKGSIFYALDRYSASFEIRKLLKEGYIILSNRYVAANMGHQGGKIKNILKRKFFFKWLYWLEYKFFHIPFPDLNIILHVEASIGQKLVDKKNARDYVSGKKRDIHEADLNHLKKAEKIYLEIPKSLPGFTLIECTENNTILSREKIHEMVYKTLKQKLDFL